MKQPVHVGITIRSFDLEGPAFQKLREHCTISYVNTTGRRLSEADLIGSLPAIEGVIAGTEVFSSEVIRRCTALQVISRVGVGTDSIDLAAAQAGGVRVATTPNSPVHAVAEHTLALLLSAMKHIPHYNEKMHRNDHSIMSGSLLYGKNVGVAGMGRVGTRVAEILEALGCRIYFFDPMVSRQVPATWKRCGSLKELITSIEILSIHAAPLPGGRPLITDDELSHAKGITIINTARGSLIDEDALIRALSSGTVTSAALDVFPKEPYTGKLLDFPQVIVTPHVASNTAESRSAMEMEAVDNLIQFFMERKT